MILLADTEITPLFQPLKRIDVRGSLPADAATVVVQELRSKEERERRDFWRTGTPLPEVFRVAYSPNPNFSGRLGALERLHTTLRHRRGETIVGMGGIGKTTLASEYCHRFGGQYAGVWWVRAEQEAVMLTDIVALGERLNIPQVSNLAADARAVLGHLASQTHPWLLVYDNAPDADRVRKWLPAGTVRYIATSRFTEFDDISAVTQVNCWSPEDTGQYLLSRTGRSDRTGASRLAQQLDGLPLAAEQAGAYLSNRQGISFDDYADDLTQLLKQPRSKGAQGEYPDTVYAAFLKSLTAVFEADNGEAVQAVLSLCSFLSPDGVDLATLLKSAGTYMPPSLESASKNKFAREDIVSSLSRFSLLKKTDGLEGELVSFHRLLLSVVRDCMSPEIRDDWAEVALNFVALAFPRGTNFTVGDPAKDPSVWPVCARLLPHVPFVIKFAPKRDGTQRNLAVLLNQAAIYLVARGDFESALPWVERAVELLRSRLEQDPPEFARTLHNLGRRYFDIGELEKAENAYAEAIAIRRNHRSEDDAEFAVMLKSIAAVFMKREDFAAAEPPMLRAEELMKIAYGPWTAQHGEILSGLGALYAEWSVLPGNIDKQPKAIEYTKQALKVTLATRGIRHPASAVEYNNAAQVKAFAGEIEDAEPDARRSVAIMYSLDLATHPHMRVCLATLRLCWEKLGKSQEWSALSRGDLLELFPAIADVERTQRSWVSEDPLHRQFGPPSHFSN